MDTRPRCIVDISFTGDTGTTWGVISCWDLCAMSCGISTCFANATFVFRFIIIVDQEIKQKSSLYH